MIDTKNPLLVNTVERPFTGSCSFRFANDIFKFANGDLRAAMILHKCSNGDGEEGILGVLEQHSTA